MKANPLPESDYYESNTHSQKVGHQSKPSNSSPVNHSLANDESVFAVPQNSNEVSNHRYSQSNNDNLASNDANYSKASDISSGYKKASPIAMNSDLSLDSDGNNSETIALKNSATADNTYTKTKGTNSNSGAISDKVNDSRVSNSGVSNSGSPFHQETHQDNNNKVLERRFMTSLIKHTGIALAIIIPLAAFTAYAATPAQTPSATTAPSTAAINIQPSAIIHKSATEPTTVDSVDLEKYAGTWYEIGRLPMYFQRNCASDVTATYTEKTDGSGIIVTNKCADNEGSQIVAEGLAKPADTTGSKLKVTFLPSWIRWLPVGRADYWVLARDADYQTALVGTPDKKYLWLLARSPNMSQQSYAKYRQIAQGQGYDLKEFTLTPHAQQTVKLVP